MDRVRLTNCCGRAFRSPAYAWSPDRGVITSSRPWPNCTGESLRGVEQAYLAGFTSRWLQEGLKRTVAPDLLVDGFLGKKTEAAVRAFQAKHGLNVDGRPRIKTCIKLWLEIDGDFT